MFRFLSKHSAKAVISWGDSGDTVSIRYWTRLVEVSEVCCLRSVAMSKQSRALAGDADLIGELVCGALSFFEHPSSPMLVTRKLIAIGEIIVLI
jgi:hypothetical protein